MEPPERMICYILLRERYAREYGTSTVNFPSYIPHGNIHFYLPTPIPKSKISHPIYQLSMYTLITREKPSAKGNCGAIQAFTDVREQKVFHCKKNMKN